MDVQNESVKIPLPSLALLNPEIPQNTGTLVRLASCCGFALKIIHPCGFVWSDKRRARASLDYEMLENVHHIPTYEAFIAETNPDDVFLFTAESTKSVFDIAIRPHHTLLFGQESVGFPDHVKHHFPRHAAIPLLPGKRSLNLAVSVAMVAAEALRQNRNPNQEIKE